MPSQSAYLPSNVAVDLAIGCAELQDPVTEKIVKTIKIKILMIMCLVMKIGTTLYASDIPQGTPAEVKKTVNSLLGHWTFDGTDTEPGAKPAKVTMKIDCKPAALNAAVACTLVGQIVGIGPVEAATVVGYSPDERLVHWTEISSTREYHDHKRSWTHYKV